MILIREITAKELARLWVDAVTTYPNTEEAAQAVLNSLQIKADVSPVSVKNKPMTLLGEAPSS